MGTTGHYLPGSSLSSSRTLFLRSTSPPGCPATVADDDTTPGAVPADNGEMLAAATAELEATLLEPVVVVGDTIFDVTEVGVVTGGVAMEASGRVETMAVVETAALTEATGMADAAGTIAGAAATDSVVVATTAAFDVGRGAVETMGTEEAIVVALDETIVVMVGRGATEFEMEAIEDVAEATVVLTTDMIGVTT